MTGAGFTPKRRVYVLDFTGDDELDGLEVRARGTTLGSVLGLGTMAEQLRDAPTSQADVEALDPAAQVAALPAALAALEGVFEPFLGALVSWNLCDEDGAPVPATRDGLLTQEPAHVMRIVRAWQRAVSDVGAGLGKDSTGGPPSDLPSLTMEPLSPSPQSSAVPA
jgi:hypothetical protein